MSGHSKWATIKRSKGVNDAKRGALFTRLLREITVSAREGGADQESNFRLRLAVDKARAANMPKENVERAIARATGQGDDAVTYEELMYEGYAPHKVPLMVKVLTDNRNRTVAEVRRLLQRSGGQLGEGSSVAWQFNRKGYLVLERNEKINPDEVFEVAAEAGADDIVTGEDTIEIFTDVDNFRAVREAIMKKGWRPITAEISMIPTTQTQLSPEDTKHVMGVIDALEELDDVQQVYSNLDISDEMLASIETA
jgi:YebC/PmpR family DNA-binding regulatory protein